MSVVGCVSARFHLVNVRAISFNLIVFKQKTAYEMRISDWSSDVCSSDLGKAAVTVLAVEIAEDDTLAALDAAAPADVLITASRAATLKLVNQRAAASGPVRIGRVPWLDLAAAVGLADPVFDLTRPLKGPFAARAVGAADSADAAIQLAHLPGPLPAPRQR